MKYSKTNDIINNILLKKIYFKGTIISKLNKQAATTRSIELGTCIEEMQGNVV